MSLILTSLEDSIGTITLNNPQKRNCLSNELLREIVAAFELFKQREIRVVIIRSDKGQQIWSAGLDINELPEPRRNPLSYEDPLEQVMREIQEFPGLVIAMIQGKVYGGACEMACTCDLVVGCEKTVFSMTPVRLGIPYNTTGILHIVNRVGHNIAKEMMLTAEIIDAQRAYEVGLLNYLVREEELEKFTYELAKDNLANSPLCTAVTKEIFGILGEAHPITPGNFERIAGLRRRVYDSKDYKEGIKAFKEKRKPDFTGCIK